MTITAERLERLGACQEQIEKFRQIWKDGPAPMTVESAVENADAFNWDWAARYLLTPDNQDEYKRAIAPAGAEYERAEAPAMAEYKRAIAPAWAEYERAEAPAGAEYERATASAWAEYERAMARAFATLYIAQEAQK